MGYLVVIIIVIVDNGNCIDVIVGNGLMSMVDFVFVGIVLDFIFDVGFIGLGMISGVVWVDDDFEFDFDEAGIDNIELSLSWYGLDEIWDIVDDVVLICNMVVGGVFIFNNLFYGEY